MTHRRNKDIDSYNDELNKFYKTERGKKVQRNNELVKRYDISLDQYDVLFVKQNGCCAICKRHRSEFKYNLAVDHDHKTKKN
jgi:hypothetical protein